MTGDKERRTVSSGDVPVLVLACCCCYEDTRGRQWHGRDFGFGLCDECIEIVGAEGVPLGGTHAAYGVRGVHWDLGLEVTDDRCSSV